MNKVVEESICSELLQAQTHLWHQSQNYIVSASVKCAVQLGIPDIIHKHGKPMTLAELARTLPINQSKAQFLSNVMRVLVNSGFLVQERVHSEEVEEVDDDSENASYALTPASRLLLKDEPLKARTIIHFSQNFLEAWQFLGDWFSNDDPAPFYTTYGMGLWQFAEKNPDLGSQFNELMEEDSRIISEVLMKEYKGVFEGLTSLVDLAGGTGTVARAIAQTFPNMRCIVFDLPHVVANSKGSENLDFVGGDLFQAIPAANAILLKWILHNWNDENCVKILKKCKEAIPSKEKGGKIVIIDIVMEKKGGDSNKSFETQSFWDMIMMMLFGSKERTKKEWAKLFSHAGFTDYKITPSLGFRSIIEVYP